MSFILDALKKSETERQQQASAEFAAVPTSRRGPRVPRWLWVLGLLLAINLMVLLGLFFRPVLAPRGSPATPVAGIQDAPADAAPTSTAATPDPAADGPSFEQRVAAAQQTIAARTDAVLPDAEVLSPAAPAALADTTAMPRARPDVTPGVVYTEAPGSSAALPTFQEVRANGAVALPDLHLDIHVYSAAPADRFVFINMSKQRENSRLAEGPRVVEITPEGVVLEHLGTTFLLARD